MAIANRERADKALELLPDGLAPFVEREARAKYAERWGKSLAGEPGYPSTPTSGQKSWDVHALPLLVEKEWRAVYGTALGCFDSSLVHIHGLHDGRSRWAHQVPMRRRPYDTL